MSSNSQDCMDFVLVSCASMRILAFVLNIPCSHLYAEMQADEERAAKYPNLTTPHTLKALQACRLLMADMNTP